MILRRPNNPFLERQGMLRPQSAPRTVEGPSSASIQVRRSKTGGRCTYREGKVYVNVTSSFIL